MFFFKTRAVLNSMLDGDKEDDTDKVDGFRSFMPDSDDDDDDEESDSELRALREEAKQPLESVLEQYGGEDALPSNIKVMWGSLPSISKVTVVVVVVVVNSF